MRRGCPAEEGGQAARSCADVSGGWHKGRAGYQAPHHLHRYTIPTSSGQQLSSHVYTNRGPPGGGGGGGRGKGGRGAGRQPGGDPSDKTTRREGGRVSDIQHVGGGGFCHLSSDIQPGGGGCQRTPQIKNKMGIFHPTHRSTDAELNSTDTRLGPTDMGLSSTDTDMGLSPTDMVLSSTDVGRSLSNTKRSPIDVGQVILMETEFY